MADHGSEGAATRVRFLAVLLRRGGARWDGVRRRGQWGFVGAREQVGIGRVLGGSCWRRHVARFRRPGQVRG